jgi:hypothetical protein
MPDLVSPRRQLRPLPPRPPTFHNTRSRPLIPPCVRQVNYEPSSGAATLVKQSGPGPEAPLPSGDALPEPSPEQSVMYMHTSGEPREIESNPCMISLITSPSAAAAALSSPPTIIKS